VACTKIAAKLLDVGNKKENNLKSLLKRYLDIKITKKPRMSNWLSNKLTREQLLYAAKDVMYLLPLLTKLEKDLEEKKLLNFAQSCFAHLPTRVRLDICGYSDIYKY
jgi:ribonuclease D